MRLKRIKKIVTMIFIHLLIELSNIKVRTLIIIGITIITAIPRYIFEETILPSISPGVKSPAKIRSTSPNK